MSLSMLSQSLEMLVLIISISWQLTSSYACFLCLAEAAAAAFDSVWIHGTRKRSINGMGVAMGECRVWDVLLMQTRPLLGPGSRCRFVQPPDC